MQRERGEVARGGWWEICVGRQAPIVVQAPNWVSALGVALEELGRAEGLERVACERLLNGTIIVNDVSRGERYTLRPLPQPPQATEVAASAAPPRGGGSPYLDWMLDPLSSIH